MTKCTECIAPNLCLAVREANDYLQSDGTLRQIIGCDTEKFIFGNLLTDSDIAEVKRKLEGE